MIFYRRIMRIDIPLTRFLPYHLAIFQTTFYQSPNIYRCHCRCIITFFFYRPVSLRNWKLAKISHERAAVNRQLIIKRRGNFLEEEVCKLKTLVSFRLLTLFETVLDNSLHGRKVYTRRNFLDRFLNEQDETLDFSQSRIHKSGIHAKYEYIRRMKINCMEFFELPLGWNFASCRTRWNQ